VEREGMTLPNGWAYAKVGDVLEVNYGHVPVYGSNGIVGQHNTALASGPCLIIGRKGAAGAVHLSRTDCWPIDTTYWTRPPAELSLEYAYYVLRTLNLSSLDRSTAIPGLNRDDLYSQVIPIAPLPEQHRIVAEIEKQFTRLDAGVTALKRAQANLKRYKAAVLKAACEGKLARSAQDPNDEPASKLLERILAERRAKWEQDLRTKGNDPSKAKYVDPAPLDTEGLPELPEGWCWAAVEQVAEHRLGKMLDKEKNKGVLRPYLRNLNVRWFEFDLSDVQYMRVMNYELESISVHAGDLVVCEGGEPGRAAVWNASEPFVIQKALHRVRLKSGLSPKYLSYNLAVDASNGNLERYFTGSTIKHFTGQSLRSYVFALPPLAEQRRIVAEVERRLSVVQEVEGVIAANLARAERLRQSILKQAFEGKLVPQDPNDEPVSVLLERIQAEREASGHTPIKRNQHQYERK
jgi:type I restriction enzyme S subunit